MCTRASEGKSTLPSSFCSDRLATQEQVRAGGEGADGSVCGQMALVGGSCVQTDKGGKRGSATSAHCHGSAGLHDDDTDDGVVFLLLCSRYIRTVPTSVMMMIVMHQWLKMKVEADREVDAEDIPIELLLFWLRFTVTFCRLLPSSRYSSCRV